MSDYLEVGIQIFPVAPRAGLEEASRCEALGFDAVWIADHYHGAGRGTGWEVPEAFSLAGAIAAATSRIAVGTCVVSLLKRDAADVAHAALTLAAVSGGRFRLGLGAGFGPDLRAFGVETATPARRVEESLIVLRGLFGTSPDRPFNFAGSWHRLEGAFLNIPEAQAPLIFLAAQGQRMLSITERYADGWMPFALTPDLYRTFLGRMPARRADFRPWLWIPTFVERSGEDRRAEAEAAGRLYLSMAPSILAEATNGEGARTRAENSTKWDPQRSEEVARQIPADLAIGVTVCGPPDSCVQQLRAFASSGCTGVVLRITDPARRLEDEEVIAREVLPKLKDMEVRR